MNMDIHELTSLVIDKFQDYDGYSELSHKKLKQSIFDCLQSEYRREFAITTMTLELSKGRGTDPTPEQYAKAFHKIEDKIIRLAQRLAITTKEELGTI